MIRRVLLTEARHAWVKVDDITCIKQDCKTSLIFFFRDERALRVAGTPDEVVAQLYLQPGDTLVIDEPQRPR